MSDLTKGEWHVGRKQFDGYPILDGDGDEVALVHHAFGTPIEDANKMAASKLMHSELKKILTTGVIDYPAIKSILDRAEGK